MENSWGAFIGLACSALLLWLCENKLWHLELSEKRDTTLSSLLQRSLGSMRASRQLGNYWWIVYSGAVAI